MSTVEEHFATLRAMKPREGGWMTEEFQFHAVLLLGAHLDELEAAWKAYNPEDTALSGRTGSGEGAMSERYCNISARLHSALYRLAERIAPKDLELLGAIGSIGDTLPDDECAALLEDWLEAGRILPNVG